jgi:hypothetical protein
MKTLLWIGAIGALFYTGIAQSILLILASLIAMMATIPAVM